MIVSWNWLKEYVRLDMPLDVLTDRLTMSGLNLEGINDVEGDMGIDLEVTSNRPDCLGHIGVAREVSVLFDSELTVPPAEPVSINEKTGTVTSVTNECGDLCPQYFARVIRGVKVGPSPDWMVARLKTLGIAAINNIVDISNYVLMESGQPLHAFDFDKLGGGRIVVRRARKGEKIVAIDQREYELDEEMCVIADAERPVAIGGVMGGLETEISDRTVSVLIETAQFAPLSIRNTARKLNLHSDSSFRFERGVDSRRLDWASRRCCELILELAGGELLSEPVVAGTVPSGAREPILLRFDQLPRILGIDIPPDSAVRILEALAIDRDGETSHGSARFIPPSWRADLIREVDLIEEVARIFGYDKIPEDAPIPIVSTAKSRHDRVTESVRDFFTAAGFYEAITLSFVSDRLSELFTPRAGLPKLRVEHSSRRQDNVLRPSLIPSLLVSRRENERHGTFNAQLFEIAKVYLAADTSQPEQQAEPTMIGCVSSRSFGEMKGIVETLARTFNHSAIVTVRPSDVAQFVEGRGAEVLLNGQFWGWMGELDRVHTEKLHLRDAVTVAELDLNVLESAAELTPTFSEPPKFPSVARDLNFVLDEAVTWQQLEEVVRSAGGGLLESMSFAGQYRGKQIDAGQKSYVLTITYRSPERTLTNKEVERAQAAVIGACEKTLGAVLR